MQFGTRAAEAPKQDTSGGGGGRWMKTLKEGETRMRFLMETKDWIKYWEHFNPTPGGFPFPCTGDKSTCPGCNSGIEKMEKASPKYAVNAKVGDYVDIYKFPAKLYNRLDVRSERNDGTIMDRDFIVTRIGKDTSTDYDVDMMMPSQLDTKNLQIHDIEQALADAFKEAWPDFNPDSQTVQKPQGFHEGEKGTEPDFAQEPNKPEEQVPDKATVKTEPAQEKEVTEAELRAMSYDDLVELCKNEGIDAPFNTLETPAEIVDWMLENL